MYLLASTLGLLRICMSLKLQGKPCWIKQELLAGCMWRHSMHIICDSFLIVHARLHNIGCGVFLHICVGLLQACRAMLLCWTHKLKEYRNCSCFTTGQNICSSCLPSVQQPCNFFKACAEFVQALHFFIAVQVKKSASWQYASKTCRMHVWTSFSCLLSSVLPDFGSAGFGSARFKLCCLVHGCLYVVLQLPFRHHGMMNAHTTTNGTWI